MKKKNIKEKNKEYPTIRSGVEKKNTQPDKERKNMVFPFVGEPQILFLKPVEMAPPLGLNFKRYVAMLFRKDDCGEFQPKVTPDTPAPKRSFLDKVPVFPKTETISFMGAQKLNLYDHRFELDEAARQAHFEKFKGKLFAKTTMPE